MIRAPAASLCHKSAQAGRLPGHVSAVTCVITRDFGTKVLISSRSAATGFDFRPEMPNPRRNQCLLPPEPRVNSSAD
jgi:hypothetical protein